MKIIITSLILFCIAFVPGNYFNSNNAEAKTTVTRDECNITVTVNLAFAFLDFVSFNRSEELIKEWVDGILEYWNEPTFNYGKCQCPVNFEVLVGIIPQGKNCFDAQKQLPDYHCMHVVNRPINLRGNVADATVISPTFPNSYGEWTTHTTGVMAAHAIGHMLGLSDEYSRDEGGEYINNNKQDSGRESIMAQNWGEVSALPEHIDRIVKKAGFDCGSLECCKSKTSEDTIDQENQAICGNAKIDKLSEECDIKASPSGCDSREECQNCQCVKKPEPQDAETLPSTSKLNGAGRVASAFEHDSEIPPPPPEEDIGTSVRFEIGKAPVIAIVPGELMFGSKKTKLSFRVANGGNEQKPWYLASQLPGWLQLSKKSGFVDVGETITASIDRSGLASGLYNFDIILMSDDDQPAYLAVKMEVE
jgi:hypothetical protein